MTQKDYIAVAAMIKSELEGIKPTRDFEPRVLQTTIIAERLADIFANDNPRFKRDVFLKASGLS